MIAIDTETYLIKGGTVPPLVCLSWCHVTPEGVHQTGVAKGERARLIAERALSNGDEVVLHNASFDLTVLMRAFPSMTPLIFEALSEGRIKDTRVRERLHKIREGGDGSGMIETASGVRVAKLSLAGLAAKYFEMDLSADKQEGSVRYSYADLAETPVEQWDEGAVRYAALDALVTALVYQAQQADMDEIDLRDQDRQVRADFALSVMSTEGIAVDPDQIPRVEQALDETLEELGAKLKRLGVLRADGKADTSMIKEIVEREHIARGLDVPKTATAEVSTARDALKATEHPSLLMYLEYKEAQKLKQTYVPSLHAAKEGWDGRLRTRYEVLMKTGRTSSKTPNLQNLPRRGGLRDCFTARAGHTLVLCDYDAAEMRTLAQCVLDLCGHETPLLKMYQEHSDYDPHAYFGAALLGISYEEMLERVKAGDKEAKEMRQRAKPANFGYAGGMGAGAFVAYAAQYGVELTESEAKELRSKWIETYDMRPWFAEAERAQVRGWVEVPRSQRRRGRVGYTQACNTPFQGMAADAAKDALFNVARECYVTPSSPLYGSRPLVFVHDEIIIESPDERAPEAAVRLSEIMCEAMQGVAPDVPSAATPALCKRWLKGAEPVYDEAGRLVPWEPSA
jgi:DNA polymerase-1